MSIVITGANRGIGLELANAYRATGQDVVATSRRAGDGLEQLDVTDPASCSALGARLAGQPVELLVCNAGVYLDKGHGLDEGYPAEAWAATFAANVTGVFLTIQALLANLRAARDARVAIISSIMASSARAPGGSLIYRSSKAAVLNLGRNLAMDLQGDGIAVGIYHPGWVRTDMGGGAADIDATTSATGLIERFEALDMARSGEFVGFDGTRMEF